jgi:transcription antitermination factor NusG
MATSLDRAWLTEDPDWLVSRWYALYTCSRHEKQVARQLERRGIEHFLPLYTAVRRWKDRRVRLQLPLFPGYVFVRIALRDRVQVLQIPGAVALVGTNGRATALQETDIAMIRRGLAGGLTIEPHPYLKVGRRVRIRSGALAGAEGVLMRKKGAVRVVISLDLIMRSVAVEVDAADVEAVPNRHSSQVLNS